VARDYDGAGCGESPPGRGSWVELNFSGYSVVVSPSVQYVFYPDP